MALGDQLEDALAIALDGVAADLPGLALQGLDEGAVVEGVGQLVTAAGGGRIHPKLEVELEPLAPLALEGQHAHVGPEPQPPHHDPLAGRHRGRARWLKRRAPLA
jgi:hypothetical protein